MRISYLIIDDFYDDPYVVRNAALHTDYARFEDQQNYPGDNSADAFEMDGLNEFVSQLVHEPVMGTPGSAHCRFRIAIAGSESRARLRMHVDGDSYWSGIVYLSLPEHCRGGTEFYRHKELGTDRHRYSTARLPSTALNPARALPGISSGGTATIRPNGST